MRYLYSIIRFVPDPARGEQVNIGAIVGSDEAGEWELRLVGNQRRARLLDDKEVLPRVWSFVDGIGRLVDQHQDAVAGAPLGTTDINEAWLERLHHDLQNVVQLSMPAPLVSNNTAEALDVLFRQLVIDPPFRTFAFAKKNSAVAAVRRAYKERLRLVQGHQVLEKATVSGNHHKESFDFAVFNGRVVQLTQTWSFQVPEQENLAEDIKAWAWTVQDIREGGGSLTVRHEVKAVAPDVDVAVAYIEPEQGSTRAVLEEALVAFERLHVDAVEVGAAEAIADRAAQALE